METLILIAATEVSAVAVEALTAQEAVEEHVPVAVSVEGVDMISKCVSYM